MVKNENKLTIDDLIIEYMIYKVKNDYEPQYSASEFMDFIHFFESRMKVEDVLYDKKELFDRFFERTSEKYWSHHNYETMEKETNPHIIMSYNDKNNDYILKATYKLSDYDKSIINTYRMDNGMSKYDDYKGTAWKIRNIISEYLKNQPKRIIDESIIVNKNELLTGKYISAEIIEQIWLSYIEIKKNNKEWPRQCRDINKYLFEYDLAEIIGIKSIKKELTELYDGLTKRIAILYHLDPNLKVSSYANLYLARSNYELLIKGYEDIIKIGFGPYRKSLEFDLSTSTFKESHETGCAYDGDDFDVATNTISIKNNKVKKLIRNIEKENKNKL